MIIPVDVTVNQIAAQGKEVPWPKPSCPRCGERLWGHRFTLAYFSGLAEAVFLRRLRCPHCRSIHRLRPKSHWRRFQSSIETIKQVIIYRWERGRWHPTLPRSRQRQR
ncbi:MAG: hypothetical protein EYX74_04345 [Desulfobulbaceae bacterium]|nr:MAG: hypothetical protein EYX74_04345 [Desulfobulbaceae bacterium]